jgi:hypothetical protein
VQIVDDEHGRVIEKGKITQELVNRHVAAKPRSGIDALHHLGSHAKRVDQREPEPLRVPPAPLDRHPCHPILQSAPIHERTSTVLVLPAGAQTKITPPGPAADKRSNRPSRAINPSAGRLPAIARPPTGAPIIAAVRCVDSWVVGTSRSASRSTYSVCSR